jgi:autotransporter-associated beta strand protein
LQLGSGGTTGNIVGDVLDNGTLVFNRSGATKNTFTGVISGSGSVVKEGSDVLELTANNSFTGALTILDGVLVAGIPAGSTQETSSALGMGDVFLRSGVLRAPTLDPIAISVGKDFAIGPAGTLELGIAGVNGKDYDHVLAGHDANIDGTLSVFSLANFRPVAGDAFQVIHADGSRTGRFGLINDFLNNNPNLQRVNIYAGNAVVLLYLLPQQPPPPPEPPPPPPPPPPTGPVLPPGGGQVPPRPPPINIETPIRVPPPDPGQPFPKDLLVQLLNPTAEQLTALFEIPFSSANIQRSVLDDRMVQIQRSIVPPPPTPPAPPPTGKEAVGKEAVGKGPPPPVYQPGPRWGVWASGYGIFGNVSDAGLARGYRFTTGVC